MKQKRSNDSLGRLTTEAFKSANKNDLIIALDNIRSRNNVGSVFRSADAFLVKQILLGGISPQPPHRDIYKTALGATESVDWKHSANLVEELEQLQKEGYLIAVVEQVEGSLSLEKFSAPKDQGIVLVLGSEIGGVDQKIVDFADVCLEITQYGTKHSLNIAVTTGIVLWQALGG